MYLLYLACDKQIDRLYLYRTLIRLYCNVLNKCALTFSKVLLPVLACVIIVLFGDRLVNVASLLSFAQIC